MEARGHAIENTQGNWISGVARDLNSSNIPESRWCKGRDQNFWDASDFRPVFTISSVTSYF